MSTQSLLVYLVLVLLYQFTICLKLMQSVEQQSNNKVLIPGFQAVRWDEARRICTDMFQGNLVVINSELRNVEVYNFAQCIMGEGNYWIGLTDLLAEGIFRQDTENLEVARFAKWFQDQPSDQDAVENCVAMGVGASIPFNRYWNDEICSVKNKFVCESEFIPTTNVILPSQLSGSQCWNILNVSQGRQFEVVQEQKTWQDAQAYCKQTFQGSLASVRSPIDNQIIYWMAKNVLGERQKVWIGGSDQEKDGNFRWVGDGSQITFDFWANVQPDNIVYQDGVSENCIELMVGSSRILGLDVDGLWIDSRCDLLRSFVCEY
eukprot:TRINITY_DN4323_c1_g1_i1.p1 TRINITY_DN4323_c1_g1~~TRINITY_DN4323_c1_g1_i1.p1  ORF type:complete len:319 (+),score=15.34 TRINITY_DN4323_c1_g1_i1:40-996(+)